MKRSSHLTSVGCLPAIALAFAAIRVAAADSTLPEVKPAELAKLSPTDFSDEDIDLPYYLFHFHTVANAVESTGPNRGFIHINVWRRSDEAYNARVMENILSLAWFYCADRPWNPYRGDPALRSRLEAALDYWIREQLPDGQFPQSGPGQGDLAATAFASKFVGEALILLHSGPPIDPAILAKAEATDRRAIDTVLTQPKMYTYGSKYENQFGGVWVGGLEYFAIHPDPELRALWEKVFNQSGGDFQSPAGYYYEKRGPDFEYTMDTHGHNSRQIWPWLRGTPFGDKLIARDAAWFDWLVLPVNARDHFTQQRRDSNQNVVFTFARRPAYYAAFTSGRIITAQQRYGLGLLWTPKLGAVLQSQTGSDPTGRPNRLPSQADSDAAAWGTQPATAATVSEATGVKASFSLNNAPLPDPAVGIHDLPGGEVAARYPLGGGGEKTVTFAETQSA
jgi:hypothetical protein